MCTAFDLEILANLLQVEINMQQHIYLQGITDALFVILGPAIIYLRLSEPYVFQELQFQLKRAFCCVSKRNDQINYSSESLDSFLNSNLNIELVSILLVSIERTMNELQMKNDIILIGSNCSSLVENYFDDLEEL